MTSAVEVAVKASVKGQGAFAKAFVRRFYLPLAMGIALGAVVLFAPEVLRLSVFLPGLEADIKFWMLSLKIPASVLTSDTAIVRIAGGATAIFLVLYALNVDFSKFFPPVLKLAVFYDLEGIKDGVDELSVQEKASLGIEANWIDRVSEYDQDAIAGLRTIWQKNHYPDSWPHTGHPRPHFTGAGYTTFKVARIGFLSYQIVESIGQLAYTVQAPRDGWTYFPGASTLVPTIHNYIRPKLLELLRRRSILIRPEFAQVFGAAALHDGLGPLGHDHTLAAVTRVTLFPFPTFGDTLYLWRSKSGANIPVARSVYT